jgi:hypothetical protein
MLFLGDPQLRSLNPEEVVNKEPKHIRHALIVFDEVYEAIRACLLIN